MDDAIALEAPPAVDAGANPALGEGEIEAEFALEAQAFCPRCQESVEHVQVIRLLRTRVNFVSSLPRRGHVMVCAGCRTILSGALGGLF